MLNEQQLLALFGSLLPLSLSLRARPAKIVYEHQDEQVRNHLAILDRYYPHLEAMCVDRPSEPVLAIAAGEALNIRPDTLMSNLSTPTAMLDMPRSELGEVIAMLLLIATQHRSSLLKHTTNDNGLPAGSSYRASDLFKSVSLGDYLERLLLLTDNERYTIAQLGSADRVRVCQFSSREQNSLPDLEDLSAAHDRGCAFACYSNQSETNLIVPLVSDREELGAIIVEVKARQEFGSSRQQEVMTKLRDTRTKMFPAVTKPRCILMLLNLAVSSTEQTSFRPLEVTVSPDDPSMLQIVVNGLQSLSILQRTDEAGSQLPVNFGHHTEVERLLKRREAMTVMTEHQEIVRQAMNPLCGAAPGYRQFRQRLKETFPGSPEESSATFPGSRKRKDRA